MYKIAYSVSIHHFKTVTVRQTDRGSLESLRPQSLMQGRDQKETERKERCTVFVFYSNEKTLFFYMLTGSHCVERGSAQKNSLNRVIKIQNVTNT